MGTAKYKQNRRTKPPRSPRHSVTGVGVRLPLSPQKPVRAVLFFYYILYSYFIMVLQAREGVILIDLFILVFRNIWPTAVGFSLEVSVCLMIRVPADKGFEPMTWRGIAPPHLPVVAPASDSRCKDEKFAHHKLRNEIGFDSRYWHYAQRSRNSGRRRYDWRGAGRMTFGM